jgi:hypothetical protein
LSAKPNAAAEGGARADLGEAARSIAAATEWTNDIRAAGTRAASISECCMVDNRSLPLCYGGWRHPRRDGRGAWTPTTIPAPGCTLRHGRCLDAPRESAMLGRGNGRMRIVVAGSGVAGLVAASELHPEHEVTTARRCGCGSSGLPCTSASPAPIAERRCE